MDKELLQDYLLKSGMNQAQSEALSRVFADTATKDDLIALRGEIKADLRVLEHKLDGKLESLKADLTWRMISSLVLLATIMTLLDVFTG